MRTHVLEACPACRHEQSVALESGEGPGLRRCTACGVVHADAYADWEDVYVDGYLTADTTFGMDVTSPELQAVLDRVADRRLRIVERVVGRRGRLLDVGCGAGEALDVARRRGWDALGVEPVSASVAVARARGLPVLEGRLEDVGLPERSFDVVGAFHVLEHMPDGLGFLRSVARWARPGGWVVVEVPNFASAARRDAGTGWVHLRPLEHVAHYTPSTLAATLRRAGLRPVRVRSLGYIGSGQGLGHMLADLGHLRWRRALARVSRPGTVAGQPARVPSTPVRALLHGVQAAQDRAGRGAVVLGIARVPDRDPRG